MMSSSKGKILFFKQMIKFSVATWIGAVLSFLVTPIVTRTFIPEELGKVNMFITYSTLLEYAAILGMNQGYVRFFNEAPGKLNRHSLFRVCVIIAWGSTLLLSLLVLAFSGPVSTAISGEPGLFIPAALCVYMISKVFLTMSNTAHRMQQKVLRYSIQALAISIAIKVSYAFAAIGGATHVKAILYMTISLVVLFVIYLFVQRRDMAEPLSATGRQELEPLLRYSIPLIPVAFMAYFNVALPKLMLKQWFGFTEIGIYSAALTLVSIITLVQAGFSIFWAPYVYKNYASNRSSIKKVHRLITFVIVLGGLFIILAQDAVYLLLGPAYRSSQAFMPLMLVSPILYTIAETTGLGINIEKKTYLNIFTYVLTILVNMVIGFLAIRTWGISGAAIAVAAAAWAMILSKTLIGEKYYRVVDNYQKSFMPPLLLTISAAANLFMMPLPLSRAALNLAFILATSMVYRDELAELFDLAKVILRRK